MEELFTRIGELIATEIDEVKDITYLNREMGYIMYLTLGSGQKAILSLVDSKL